MHFPQAAHDMFSQVFGVTVASRVDDEDPFIRVP